MLEATVGLYSYHLEVSFAQPVMLDRLGSYDDPIVAQTWSKGVIGSVGHGQLEATIRENGYQVGGRFCK